MGSGMKLGDSWRMNRSRYLKAITPFLGLLAVILFFQVFSDGRLLTARNLKTLLNELFFITIGAVGYAFLMSQGNLDFSIGSNMAVSCAVGAMVAQSNPLMALPAGILVGTLIGSINGLLYARLRISSFIATLAMQFILSGFVIIILKSGVIAAPLEMIAWNTIPLKLGVMLAVLAAGFVVFAFTEFGKIGRAVGSCEEAARLSGVNVTLVKFLPFAITGALVGMLSFFSLIRTGTASNHTGDDLLMDVLNAVLLGGMPLSGGASTKYRAVVIGSLTMTILANGMAMLGMGSFDRQLIKGVVFLVAIALSFDRRNVIVNK